MFHDSIHYASIQKNNELNVSPMNILNQLLNMMLQADENKSSSSKQLMGKIKEQPEFKFDKVHSIFINHNELKY